MHASPLVWAASNHMRMCSICVSGGRVCPPLTQMELHACALAHCACRTIPSPPSPVRKAENVGEICFKKPEALKYSLCTTSDQLKNGKKKPWMVFALKALKGLWKFHKELWNQMILNQFEEITSKDHLQPFALSVEVFQICVFTDAFLSHVSFFFKQQHWQLKEKINSKLLKELFI